MQHRATEEVTLLKVNPNRFYGYVSQYLRPRSGYIVLNDGGTSLNEPNDISQCFVKEFCKNFSTNDADVQKVVSSQSDGLKLELINVDVNSVRKLLSKLK